MFAARCPGGRGFAVDAQAQVTVVNKYGLHARPAMQLVDLANRFPCRISVSNGADEFDAKSIMQVMQLAATKGSVLTLKAEGQDADQAVRSLRELVSSGFGEE